MIRFIRRHTRLALLALLAAGALACGPSAGIGGGGAGVDVAVPVCTVNVIQRPTLAGVIGDRHVTAVVNLSCVAPYPLTHHAEAWLAPNGDVSGDPRKAVWGVADRHISDTIPDPEGITFKLDTPCKNTSPAKRTWRVDVETSGKGPPSKAAPNGIPFTMKLDERPEDMKPTDLPCRFS